MLRHWSVGLWASRKANEIGGKMYPVSKYPSNASGIGNKGPPRGKQGYGLAILLNGARIPGGQGGGPDRQPIMLLSAHQRELGPVHFPD
jgi:hypothetical protein